MVFVVVWLKICFYQRREEWGIMKHCLLQFQMCWKKQTWKIQLTVLISKFYFPYLAINLLNYGV